MLLKISMNNIVEVSHLSISYDKSKTNVLRDISFTLWEWEILSIIGKNGTGKSSLLKAVAGITSITSGNIQKSTRKISYVPQKLHMEKSFPLQVKEFLKIFNTQISDTDIKKNLELFHVSNLFERNIHVLSGGEFQKILIINALLSKPELLLLDEPTSWIDMVGEEKFYENIALIKELYPKIAIILVSHNLHLVYKNSTRILCLHDNNLCCHGSPKEILENDEIKDIFWDYLRPYQHHPHSDHHHTH